MMPTLQDILENDLGLGSEQPVEKTASQNVVESDEIEKLAMEIGLVEEHETTSASQEEQTEQVKEARMGLDSLYANMFPADADIVGSEKVAEQQPEMDKEAAAVEEAKGAFAYGKFQEFVDAHLDKIAGEIAKEASEEAHPQAMANNEDKSGKKIDTTPQHQGKQEMGTNPEGAVGEFEMKTSPDGETKSAGAYTKEELFAEVEKTASSEEEVETVKELYNAGEAMAKSAADELDKLAAEAEEEEKEEKEEEEKLDEEQKKEASASGAIIARAYIDNLIKEGQERHGDAFHYLRPALAEKLAAAGKAGMAAAMWKTVKGKGKQVAKKLQDDASKAVTGKSMSGKKVDTAARMAAGGRLAGKAAVGGLAAYGAKKAVMD